MAESRGLGDVYKRQALPPASCSPPWRSWGPNINADESALWLSEIIPAPLEFRYVDERRLGLASLADAQSLALTTTFNTTDTGLQSQDDGADVRCELLTVARTEQPGVAAAINAAADTFEKAGGLLPAQPGVMLPSILDVPDVTVPVSYTHLTLPTTARRCRSRWSPYH